MDIMQGEGNNQNGVKDISLSVKDSSLPISKDKVNKLVTATYMVTDMIDLNEPLRSKIRMVSLEVVTDIFDLKDKYESRTVTTLLSKLELVLSYLSLAKTIGIISSMNGGILESEYTKLKDAVLEARNSLSIYESKPNLEQFFSTSESESGGKYLEDPIKKIGGLYSMSFTPPIRSIRQGDRSSGTRIGVQKGSTLMQALTEKVKAKNNNMSLTKNRTDFEELKQSRKDEIILIIKTKNLEQSSTGLPLGVTLMDIKSMAKSALKDTGEKTIQRDLMSLIDAGVLYKEGSKRWSKYFLK